MCLCSFIIVWTNLYILVQLGPPIMLPQSTHISVYLFHLVIKSVKWLTMGWNRNFISERKCDFSLHTTSWPAVQAYAAGYPKGISGIVTIYLCLLLQSICEQHFQLAHTFLWYGTSTLFIQFLRAEIISPIYTVHCPMLASSLVYIGRRTSWFGLQAFICQKSSINFSWHILY